MDKKSSNTRICIIHYLINYTNTYIDCVEYEKIKNYNQRFIQQVFDSYYYSTCTVCYIFYVLVSWPGVWYV